MFKALERLRVLDFSQAFTGPTAALILADLGAEVIKVEMPGRGDMQRAIPPFVKGLEANIFINVNRGKKSITLNLKSERGRQIAKDLVTKVDVLVENFSFGVMDRFGLGYEELAKLNPKLIYASASGFGRTGHRRTDRAFDTVAQVRGGLALVTGFPDNPPTKAGPAIADFLTGFHLAIGIMGALIWRSKTGEGQLIDISMQDCVWWVTAVEFSPWYFLTGKAAPRFGNGIPQVVPFDIYQAKDGYVTINTLTIEQWEALLRVMSREDLIRLPRYSQSERINYRDEVNALVQNWVKAKGVEEITKELRDARVPCEPVPSSFEEVCNDPQLLSRQMIVEIDQPASGRVVVPGSPLKLSKTPVNIKDTAPALGEHNFEVYSKLLGYNEHEIRQLADDGII